MNTLTLRQMRVSTDVSLHKLQPCCPDQCMRLFRYVSLREISKKSIEAKKTHFGRTQYRTSQPFVVVVSVGEDDGER
jgi:hypothetical protein